MNYKKYPWYVSFQAAKRRCSPEEQYFKLGIKFLMTKEDFKYLWFRDKAYELKKPSIDRIDSNGHYELSNCRFIELKENLQRPKEKHTNTGWDKYKVCSQCKTNNHKYYAKGLCKYCYNKPYYSSFQKRLTKK